MIHEGDEGIILIEKNMSVKNFFDKTKDEEYTSIGRKNLIGFRNSRRKTIELNFSPKSNVTCLHWVIKNSKFKDSAYLYQRLLNYIGGNSYIFYQLGCDVEKNQQFYEKQGAKILKLSYKRNKTPSNNPFKFAYQRGDSNGSFQEFMTQFNTKIADDNNNNIEINKKNNVEIDNNNNVEKDNNNNVEKDYSDPDVVDALLAKAKDKRTKRAILQRWNKNTINMKIK